MKHTTKRILSLVIVLCTMLTMFTSVLTGCKKNETVPPIDETENVQTNTDKIDEEDDKSDKNDEKDDISDGDLWIENIWGSDDKKPTNSPINKPSSNGGSNGNSNNGPDSDNTDVKVYRKVTFAYPDNMSEEDKKVTILPEAQLVDSGELVYSMPLPTRDGYVFAGWYYDSDLALLAGTDDVVKKNITLYPKMVKSTDPIAAKEGSLNYVSALDAETSHKITVKAPNLESVKNGVLFTSITDGNITVPFTVDDNGDGTYTVLPEGGLKAGKTYQLSAIDREKGITADGIIPADDDYVLFIYDGEVQKKEIRFYNIFTTRKEESNLKIDDDVKFIKTDEVSGFDMEGATGLYTISLSKSNGSVAMKDNSATGVFTYSGNDISVGDVIAIHDGKINTEENTVVDGDVAYVEITSIEGNKYFYKSAKAEDVVFLPDVLPVPKHADKDNNENTFTLDNDVLDFTYFEDQQVLNGDTKANVGDFIALYEGVLGEAEAADYYEITGVKKGVETTVVTVKPVTVDELKNALSTYETNGVDMVLPEKEVEKLEEQIIEQAEESGFAEKSAQYILQNKLGVDEKVVFGKKYHLSADQMQLFGMDVEAGNLSYMVRLDPPDIRADITTKLKKVTQINKGTGLRVAFGVTIPVGIDVVENGLRVVESFYLDLYVTFEQEVKFNTRFSADIKWGNCAKIIWWIKDVVVNAGFDMGVYTGVGAVASVYTEKYHQKSYFWNELVEKKDGTFSSASNIATKLNNMLKDGNVSFFNVDEENSLINEYSKMLEREIDYVDILAIRLYHNKGYVDPKTHIVNYVLDVELVFGAKLNITMGVSFEALSVKEYSFTLNMFDAKGSASVVDKQTPYTNFNFFIMGNLGLRAGIRVTFSIGLISVKIDNLGAMIEVGVYLDLYGFFYFHYDWNGETNKHNVQSGGALYAAIGLYVDLDLFGGVLLDLASFRVHLYEGELELWNSGNADNIVSVVAPEFSQTIYNTKTVTISPYNLRMRKVNVLTGKTEDVIKGLENFAVSLTNPKFSYDKSTGSITVNPEDSDIELSTQARFTYTGKTASFTKEPLTVIFNLTWKKTEPSMQVEYYEPFTIIYKDGEKFGSPDDSRTRWFIEGSKLPALENYDDQKPGYDFFGWQISCAALPEYDGKMLHEVNCLEGVKMPDVPIGLTPIYVERTDTPFTITHLVASVDDPSVYEVYEEVKKTGKTGDRIGLEEVLSKEGFTHDISKFPVNFTAEIADGIMYTDYGTYIAGDGSTNLCIYYNRDEYRVTFYANNPDYEYFGEDEISETKLLRFGQELQVPDYAEVEIPGYTFKGWSLTKDGSSGIIELPETISVSENKSVEYYAIWEADEVEFEVNYFIQNSDGTFSKEPSYTEVHTAPAGTRIDYSILAPQDESLFESTWYSHCSAAAVVNDEPVKYEKTHIDALDYISLSAYYKPNYKQVWWNNTELDYHYQGEEFTIPAESDSEEFKKAGYTLIGWKSLGYGDEKVYLPGEKYTMGEFMLYFSAVYEANDDTPYVVKHIREDVDGSFTSAECETETEKLTGTTDTKVKPEVKAYEGYTSPEKCDVTISGDGSTVLNYHYYRNKHNIKFELDGGILRGTYTSSYKYGVPFYLFEYEDSFSATKTGYVFKGFYLKGDETKTLIDTEYYISGDEIYSDEDIVFVALWEAEPYNYKTEYYLEQLDGTYVLTQTETDKAPFGSTVNADEITFTGFTVNKNVSGSVSSGVITSDDNLTLKLYYTRNTYDAKWMSYDGSTVLATTKVKFGDTIKAPTTFNQDNTRSGYALTGWLDVEYGKMSTAGATLYAKTSGIWTAANYTVEFNGNGATSGTMQSQNFVYGNSTTLKSNAFVKTGYVFNGWNTKADGTGVNYADQEAVLNLAVSGTVTLYAQWVAGNSTAYKVEHYFEDLTGNFVLDSSKTQNFTGVTNSTVNASAITVDGFTFDSNNTLNVKTATVNANGNTVLKLYYTRNSYDLVFDFNNSTIKTMVDIKEIDEETGEERVVGKEVGNFSFQSVTVSVKYGQTFADAVKNVTIPEAAGYTFENWTLENASYNESVTMPVGGLTLFANWKPIEITITFYCGNKYSGYSGATGTTVTKTYNYGDEISLPELDFAYANRVIAGWVFNDCSGGPGNYPIHCEWPLQLVYGRYGEGVVGFFDKNKTSLEMSPYWSKDYTEITFNVNGGTGSMQNQIHDRYASVMRLFENKFTRDGYSFVGWNTEKDGSGVAYSDCEYFTPVEETGKSEVILYAQWKENSTN